MTELMRDDFRGWGEENVSLADYVYYEAGHAVMYGLLKSGKAVEFVPRDRTTMLPPFPGVQATPHGMDWGDLTRNLGSMLTGAQVLLAGWIAVHEQPGSVRELDTTAIRIRRADHLLAAYAEEYVSDDDFARRDAAAAAWLAEMHASVRGHIHRHWPAVKAVAAVLLSTRRTFSEVETARIIKRAER